MDLPPVDLSLSLEESFEKTRLSKGFQSLSRDELEEAAIALLDLYLTTRSQLRKLFRANLSGEMRGEDFPKPE